MNDNIMIEELEFTEEMYKRATEENVFEEDFSHGIGEEVNGNS